MALIKDFEIPGTGLTASNAYHVISDVKTTKRLQDIKPPVDSSREDGLTGGDLGEEVNWKAGYIGKIAVQIFASKEARDAGKDPIGGFGESPTDAETNVKLEYNDGIKFMIDPASDQSILAQAYAHLKGLPYYVDAEEV